MKKWSFFPVLVAVVGLVSCAHKSTSPSQNETGAGPLLGPTKDVQSFHLSDPQPPQVVDQELEVIPTEMNDRVQQWINYFQGKGRPHMERYLARSTRYMALMKRILRENGLPEDLIYIALIESGFSSRATSRAAAVGYWQFIRGTGKRYGLEINGLVDERRDPVLATQAAAEYFKGLYSVFGSWYLAMASYNVGENRVKREVMNHYTRDFWELARKRRFPKETINYVPKFIAAKIIGRNPEKYGFTEIDYEKPIEFDVIKVESPLNLRTMAAKLGLEYEDFKQINPKFRGEIAPTKENGTLELRVPVGQTQAALVAARESIVDRVELIADAGDTQTYRIRSGDSLHSIARKYKTTVAWLRDTNDIKAGKRLRVGMRIQVPDRSFAKKPTKAVAKAENAVKPDDQEKAAASPEVTRNGVVYYLVQPGDTLSAIADEYDSSVKEIRRMNKLTKNQTLKVGMRLRVPKDDGLPSAPDSLVDKSNSTEKSDSTDGHVVRSGENLTTIATQYGVTIEALRKANNMGNRSTLKVGSRLMIPGDEKSGPSATEGGARRGVSIGRTQARILASAPGAVKKRSKIHVVRRGENLSRIASNYGVSLGRLKQKNQLGAGSKVLVGSKLLIPMAEASESR